MVIAQAEPAVSIAVELPIVPLRSLSYYDWSLVSLAASACCRIRAMFGPRQPLKTTPPSRVSTCRVSGATEVSSKSRSVSGRYDACFADRGGVHGGGEGRQVASGESS